MEAQHIAQQPFLNCLRTAETIQDTMAGEDGVRVVGRVPAGRQVPLAPFGSAQGTRGSGFLVQVGAFDSSSIRFHFSV